ncbi:hypothetical protein CLV30_10291 [Haloactinopolyspora alba]|uniref:ATP synthase protein I n=1 Tax=Haloactinopolyspora alba TaxID=648780 RepID=A0A2P8EB55_9ACTN|nr:hypothetical protein CLV30_10291 [Haloactinopolyspora alba]
MARRATVAAGVVCAVLAWVTAGTAGLVGAAGATLLVVGFFWSGMIPLFVVRELRTGAGTGMAVLLLTYTLRLAVVLMALQVSSGLDALDERSLGVTIVACALTWILVHVVTSVRGHQPRSSARPPDFVADDPSQ